MSRNKKHLWNRWKLERKQRQLMPLFLPPFWRNRTLYHLEMPCVHFWGPMLYTFSPETTISWLICLSFPHFKVSPQPFTFASTFFFILKEPYWMFSFVIFFFLLHFMFLRFIHVSEVLFHYFLLVHHSIVWLLQDLFSLSPVDGYLGCVPFFC